MKIEVDARGQACPKPVIMTKKELDRIENGIVTTIVDNEVARDNISKLAVSLGYSLIIDKGQENEFYLHINKGAVGGETFNMDSIPRPRKNSEELTIAIGSDKMGSGQEELGKILMRSFIYTVRETTPLPKSILFFNSGVYLTCQGSEVLDDLKYMLEQGVELISCGTCLDYYKIQDQLSVGEIGNMYSIYEKMKNAQNTINI